MKRIWKVLLGVAVVGMLFYFIIDDYPDFLHGSNDDLDDDEEYEDLDI